MNHGIKHLEQWREVTLRLPLLEQMITRLHCGKRCIIRRFTNSVMPNTLVRQM
ncbi:Uncharacterised protein [Vibrio cholerae]|nr:Uncharacterised protein [Vibrio cholerae]